MKPITNKIILLLFFLLLSTICINAQSIKASSEQQKRQQEYEKEIKENELKEAARIQKAQLNLNNLLQLLQSKDLDYVDRFLTGRGWKLHSTFINDDNNNNEEIPSGFKSVTWTFDKNEYNDLAKGWFYFYLYPSDEDSIVYDNAIAYVMFDEIQVSKLKLELVNNGFKKIQATNAVTSGLESVYKNDLYEIHFKKQLKESGREGAEFNYTFFIFNYKQIIERKAEAERIEREKIEKEEKYQNAVKRAEAAFFQKQYQIAKQAYSEAVKLKPENEEILSDKIADIDINLLCQNADNFFKDYQYQKAKDEYGKALLIKQNTKTEEIQSKIKEIDTFILFLKDRTYKKYDLQDIERSNYTTYYQRIEEELKKFLLNEQNIPKSSVSIICEVDTSGFPTTKFTSSSKDIKLVKKLEELCKSVKLNPVFFNGYSVNTIAEFKYNIEAYHAIVIAKKRADNISSNNENFNLFSSKIETKLISAPIGKYTFNMNTALINNKEYDNNQLIKMRRIGGPSNALLSMLIPGLGLSNVTGGKTSGLSTALWTYGLIGAGIGFKAWSISEYKAYHSSIIQSDIDEHYDKASSFNTAFYISVGAGVLIWATDILLVANKGFNNKKAQKAWKQNHLGVYYNHEFNASGLSYTINF